MSSNEAPTSSPPTLGTTEATNITIPAPHRQVDQQRQSTPVEMSQFHTSQFPQTGVSSAQEANRTTDSQFGSQAASSIQTIPIDQPLSFDGANTSPIISPPPPAVLVDQIAAQPLNGEESSAIGPSCDGPIMPTDTSATSGPSVQITLLLITGARHPYTIDEKYLRRRKVVSDGEEVDPFSISVYTMKELIWRDWREEWDPRPTSPSSIRLIHFGKLLDDKVTLKDCRFQEGQPNVVHMTVKPQEIIDDDENAKSGKATAGRDRSGSESGSGCRCCIVQ